MVKYSNAECKSQQEGNPSDELDESYDDNAFIDETYQSAERVAAEREKEDWKQGFRDRCPGVEFGFDKKEKEDTEEPEDAEPAAEREDASTRRSSRTTVENINQDYAVVQYGGKVCALKTKGDEPQFMSLDSLKLWLSNQFIQVGEDSKGAFKTWMQSRDRRQYEKIVFQPGRKVPANQFNLWQGWGLQAQEYDYSVIANHIKNIICDGNEEYYEYMLNWMAHIFQKPLEKPDVAIILRGLKGVGKDLLGLLIRIMVGERNSVHIEKPDDLTARFNGQFGQGVFVHIEEAFFSADKSKKGVLQALITSPTMNLEFKYLDKIKVPSYLRFLMSTNEDWAVPATVGERRYFVLDVSNKMKGNFDYFKKLVAAINGKPAQGFLNFLMQRDISKWCPRTVPQTGALLDQKLLGLTGFDAWWYDLLSNAELPEKNCVADNYGKYSERHTIVKWENIEANPTRVRKDCLRDHYTAFLRSRRFEGNPILEADFGRKLAGLGVKAVNGKSGIYSGMDGKPCRPNSYKMPLLSEARKAFSVKMGGDIEWPYVTDEEVEVEPPF